MRICVITYNCKVVVGPGAQICTLLEVWVLGVGMSTLDAQTTCTTRIGGSKYRLSWSMVTLIGPDFPSIETRQLGRGFQIDMFRPIRLDHTNCLQVAIKTHSFNICNTRITSVTLMPHIGSIVSSYFLAFFSVE
jgi:hypothetical protein